MQSKVTIYGPPVHPMIIVLPLGLLPASVFADLCHHIIDDPTWGSVSFWLMVAGVLSGLAAGAIGFMDWRSLARSHKSEPRRRYSWSDECRGDRGISGEFALAFWRS
jgi:uncharacterized membrane protein